jgi:xanthine dehydrogenase small subunit
LDVEAGVVRRARIGLGGVAATPVRAYATEAVLDGQPWREDVVRRAAEVMATEGTPLDDHRASAAYRAAMLGQALLKLFAQSSAPEEVSA